MSYNGFEIDMLDVGDADCLLVTKWQSGKPIRVLIDGGNQNNAPHVRAFLRNQGINYIDHVVCTHPHDDHAGGLVEIVADRSLSFGCGWMHVPYLHVDRGAVERALASTYGLDESVRIEKSMDMAYNLVNVFETRGIVVYEPFAGDKVEFMVVCGPTRAYYEALLENFVDAEKIRSRDGIHSKAMALQALAGFVPKIAASTVSESLLENPQTSPENNSCVIMATMQEGGRYLFTADAGAEALQKIAYLGMFNRCRWMQLPHHGSRRNITADLIEYFAPDVAYVSATGSPKHPRRAVVNAFKKLGTRVYSTHYPHGGNKCHSRGSVPERPGYTTATPLWEADK